MEKRVEKMSKKLSVICLLCLLVVVLMPLSIDAKSKIDPQKGFPYDDYTNYKYVVKEHPSIKSGWQGSDYVLACEITVRDKNASLKPVLSVDEYVVTIKGLPLPPESFESTSRELLEVREVLLDEEVYNPYGARMTTIENNQANYSYSYSLGSLIHPNTVENWKKYTGDIYGSEHSEYRYENIGKHEARFRSDFESEGQIQGHLYYNKRQGDLMIYLDEIQIPNSLFHLSLHWYWFSRYYLSFTWDDEKGAVTNVDRLPYIEKYEKEAEAKIQEFINRFANVTVEINKTPHLTEAANINRTVSGGAAQQKGETDRSVPAAIVLGTAGLLAAAAGATGGSGGGGGEGGKKEPESTFKMYIKKDFGDKIRCGAQPVLLQARIAGITTGGTEVDRPDLSQQLEIFSPDKILQVSSPSFVGNYKQAAVRLPKCKSPLPAKAVVSFRLTGKGGVFQNNVSFALIGESQIKLAGPVLPILATAEEKFELPYELVDFLEKPEVELNYKSDLFELTCGKNKKGQDVILAQATEKAGKMNFKRFVHRYACEITAKNEREKVTEKFELHLCYEGIGTAFLQTPNNSSPEEILIPCAIDETVRKEKTFALPLTVMVWNEKQQVLEVDEEAVKTLIMKVGLATSDKLKPGSEAYEKFQKMVEEAKIEFVETKNAVEVESKLKPKIFGLCATGKEADADIELELTFSSERSDLTQFVLKAKTSNEFEYKAMIRWLFEYPAGSYAAKYIRLGSVEKYHQALDHLVGVFQYDRTPNLVRGFRHRSTENYYEHGKGDMMRDAFIALHVLPTGIGDLKGITLLYHELTHTLEDILLDERDGTPADGCERHAELFEELAPVLHYLHAAEKSGGDINNQIRNAIIALSSGVNKTSVRPWLEQTMSTTMANFGARYTMLPKALFYDYATNYDGPNVEVIKSTVCRFFCPAKILRYYDIVDGLFAGGEILFRWNEGVFYGMEITCPGFIFDKLDQVAEWVPNKEKLFLKFFLTVQKEGAPEKEYVHVLLEGNQPYLFDQPEYLEMKGFTMDWEIGVPPGRKFYDPPEASPFYQQPRQYSILKSRT